MNLTFEQLPEVVKIHTELLIIDKNLYHNRSNTEQYVADLWNTGSRTLESNVRNSITNAAIRSHLDGFRNQILAHKSNRNTYTYDPLRLLLALSDRAGEYRTQAENLSSENSQLKQQLQEHQTCQTEKEELQKQITQLKKEKQELQQKFDEAWNALTGGNQMEAKVVQQTNLPLKGGNN